jgi:MoxR-like ATPase
MTQPYPTSLHHLLAELERIDLLIRVQVWRAQQGQAGNPAWQGCYIADEEITALFDQPLGLPRWATAPSPLAREEIQAALGQMRQAIDQRQAASLAHGVPLRLAQLAYDFTLAALDIDILLICLASAIDLRYEQLYAYLQNDATAKRPSVDLVLNLLCPSLTARLAARAHLRPEAPLLKHHLVQLFDAPECDQASLLRKVLQVDERVVDHLLDTHVLDARLAPYVQLITPQRQWTDLLLPPESGELLARLAQANVERPQPLILYVHGPYGVGKQSAAEALCQARGLHLLVVDGASALNGKTLPFDTLVRLACREAILQHAALYWSGFDTLLADDRRAEHKMLLRALEQHSRLTFLAGETAWEPIDVLPNHTFVRMEFPLPTAADRLHLWTRMLAGQRPATRNQGQESLSIPLFPYPLVSETDLAALATQFRLSGGQIQDAARTARNLARRRDPVHDTITLDDLYAACRLQSNPRLATLAQKIASHATWDDLVLPPDRIRQLREICDQVRHRAHVHDAWGFGCKLAQGKGLNALFAGPSGTGKTMAAGIIAGALGLDLYKIDLATVVSKYIGETEKNLARIFTEADNSNAILFFDEADALFGKRSEVKDAHDRYANLEVAYLLQRMEEYEGVTILATNLRKNMDEAFVRRMHFIVEFPFPGERDRRRIWEGVWPAATPRDASVDLDFMARRIEIAGGNIRNVALAAAFLAAAAGGIVTMEHLIHATRREYQKMGKVVGEAELGEYA